MLAISAGITSCWYSRLRQDLAAFKPYRRDAAISFRGTSIAGMVFVAASQSQKENVPDLLPMFFDTDSGSWWSNTCTVLPQFIGID